MDALTNVVAVLILVLILVQADVSQKVQKFLDNMVPATPEQIADVKERNIELLEKVKKLEAAMKEDAPTPERIEEEKLQLALLEKTLVKNKEKLADLAKLREIEAKVKAERDAESKKTKTVQDEIAKLEGLLENTPPPEADTPTVVNIPNSRPIPSDAKIYYAMANKGRIHVIDPNAAMKIFEEEFRKHRKEWRFKRIKIKNKTDRFIYDGGKIVAFFKNYDWGNTRGQKVEIIAYPTATRLRLAITPNLEKGGTPTGDLATPGSGYYKAAASLLRDFSAVLMFRVSLDSFDTYLEARRLADRANIATGWELNGSRNYVEMILLLEVRRPQEPPPPKPGGKPRPPGPPPLKPKLD